MPLLLRLAALIQVCWPLLAPVMHERLPHKAWLTLLAAAKFGGSLDQTGAVCWLSSLHFASLAADPHPLSHAAGPDKSIQLTSATADTAAADPPHPLQPASQTETVSLQAGPQLPAAQAHHSHQQQRRPRSSVGGISAMDTCGPAPGLAKLLSSFETSLILCHWDRQHAPVKLLLLNVFRPLLIPEHCCRLAIMNGLHRTSSRREQPKRLRPRRNTGEVPQAVPKHAEDSQPRFAHAATLRRGIGSSSSRPEPHYQVRTV